MANTFEPIEYNPKHYAPDYNDIRFNQVTNEKNNALTEAERTYGGMVAGTDKFYNKLNESTQKWADTQTDIQNQQTDFAIQQIEQQKAQTQKDYEKEQAGAYVDWRKQSNEYGSEAEKMASAGLANTGYAESSQVSMYNTYQNRVATARESFQQAWMNYNNKITEAKLQNNAAIAEIALTALEKQAEYSLQAFQYKNQLLLDLQDKKLELNRFYADEWQRVLDQFNVEAERKFQFAQQQNEFAFEAEQDKKRMDFDANQAAIQRDWQEEHDKAMAEIEQDYAKELAEIEQGYKIAYLEAETEEEKKRLEAETEEEKKRLEAETTEKKKIMAEELENAQALATHNAKLEKQNNGTTFFKTGSDSGSKLISKAMSAVSKATNNYESQINGITTYAQAKDFAKKLDVDFGALSKTDWNRLKKTYSTVVEAKYTSYEAYIQDYCRYLASKK